MSTTNPSLAPQYSAVLVPALQKIQHEFGYLKREAMQQFSEKSGIPLYRLQAVASFFPHFQLTEPTKVIVKVCRDMACGMADSAGMIRALQAALPATEVTVEGVSCLGRCDRPPAVGVGLIGHEHDDYFLGRDVQSIAEIAKGYVRDQPPTPDKDADLGYPLPGWEIDAYEGRPAEYEGIRKVVAARDAAIEAASELLASKYRFPPDRVEQFRTGAIRQLRLEGIILPEARAVVRIWQTAHVPGDPGKSKDPTKAAEAVKFADVGELGNWSEGILKELQGGDLRGLGGAGIPAIQKWRDIRDAIRTARGRDEDDRGFIVVNGDESEPGTFKDREILLHLPHTVLEGVIIAGMLSEATQGFIYIRHEYGEQIEACRQEIRRAESLGFCGENAFVLGRPFPVSVFVSPGGYICGEQSALIEAMSDRRGEPRNMPPKLETNGLIDLPTLVSNVETYGWAPYIVVKGGATYSSRGVNTWKGRRFFSLSGDVNRPGVYEVPMGMTLRELIEGENYCQGMLGGRPLKAFAPSGPSGGFLPAKLTSKGGLPSLEKLLKNKAWLALAERRGFDPNVAELDLLDMELELNFFRSFSPTSALGAGVVVYDDRRDMMEQALNSLEFYRNESCGKCVPCRTGSQKFVSLATNIMQGQVTKSRWDELLVPLVKEMGRAIELASICGLGRSVPVPIITAMNFFPDDVERHLAGGRNGHAH